MLYVVGDSRQLDSVSVIQHTYCFAIEAPRFTTVCNE